MDVETLPKEVKDIINSFDENQDSYYECKRIQTELNSIGYDCDYDLSGEIIDIKPLDIETIDKQSFIKCKYVARDGSTIENKYAYVGHAKAKNEFIKYLIRNSLL